MSHDLLTHVADWWAEQLDALGEAAGGRWTAVDPPGLLGRAFYRPRKIRKEGAGIPVYTHHDTPTFPFHPFSTTVYNRAH